MGEGEARDAVEATGAVGTTASRVLAALDGRRRIASLERAGALPSLAAAYRVARAVRRAREARGERPVGRKIGFTNTRMWDEHGVRAPIWSTVYDTTSQSLPDERPFDLGAMAEPRIEPEIVFGLARAPEPGMDEAALLGCVAFVAHGFEIVQSLYPGWRFTAADTVAAFGLHGALLVGPPSAVTPGTEAAWRESLSAFTVTLLRDGVVADEGSAAEVLGGGPLTALRHLVGILAADPDGPPLAAGEIVSTGTLTRALPVAPGETWTTRLSGLPLPGLSLTLA
ncbi:2-keto-4-pentenoate hydratase [Methylobacterium oryzisoli]|uniref:2-keto-4-pentenoate hydratase n=1 Tax=Methylobacterium oryzisoli TaxID=3385502 RepID=UPI003891A31E